MEPVRNLGATLVEEGPSSSPPTRASTDPGREAGGSVLIGVGGTLGALATLIPVSGLLNLVGMLLFLCLVSVGSTLIAVGFFKSKSGAS